MLVSMKKLTLVVFTFLLLSGFTPEKSSSNVYICTGPKATVYHSSFACSGMNSCCGNIVAVGLVKAEKWDVSLAIWRIC